MRTLVIIWFIFALLFSVLAIIHLNASTKKVALFKISERLYNKRPDVEIKIDFAGSDIDEPLENFVKDFNSYINDYNKTSRDQNRIAALGYFLAALTAIVSMILTLRSKT